MSNIYSIIIIPRISEKQFQDDKGYLEEIAHSISGDNVFALYGAQASYDNIYDILRIAAGSAQVPINPQWKASLPVKRGDKVFVFVASHGKSNFGASWDIVFPSLGKSAFSHKCTITTARTYDMRTGELYRGNPIEYDKGILSGGTGIFVGGSGETTWTNCRDQAAFWKVVSESTTPSVVGLIKKGDKSIEIPCLPEIRGEYLYTPTQREINAWLLSFFERHKVWQYKFLDTYEVIIKKSDGTSVIATDIDGEPIVGVHRDDNGEVIVEYLHTKKPGESYDFNSYLPPPGLLSLNTGHSRFETAGGKWFSDDNLAAALSDGVIDVNGNQVSNSRPTNMFFFIESCMSGYFCRAVEYLRKKETKGIRQIGMFTAAAADKLSWGGVTPEFRTFSCNHFCGAIYLSMFSRGMFSDKYSRKWRTTYGDVEDDIRKYCKGDHPISALPQSGCFSRDDTVPGGWLI